MATLRKTAAGTQDAATGPKILTQENHHVDHEAPKGLAPRWMAMPHIKHGYRVGHSFSDMLGSAFTTHNQTVNIWQQTAGLVAASALLASHLLYPETCAVPGRSSFVFMLMCLVLMFALSSCYHTFREHSPGIFDVVYKLDQTGIVVLTAGNMMATITHIEITLMGEPTHSFSSSTYSVMTLTLAGLCLVAVYNYRNMFNKQLRAAILASFVVSGLIPATHWYLLVSDNSQFRSHVVSMFFFFGLGFIFWVTRIPERWAPGNRFLAIWFQSRHIWHICIYIANASLYFGLLGLRHALAATHC